MRANIEHIPVRPSKERKKGITMMMDKGLSIRQVEDFIESCGDFTDIVKFGFGTALITSKLKDKIKLYKEANIKPYFGGTLFEVFAIRDKFDQFCSFLDEYDMELAEISDGSMDMQHDDKLEYIHKLKEHVTVLSEVGSKKAGVNIPAKEWVGMMKKEIDAGVWKVITEARESGTVGIYNQDGTANIALIDDIILQVNPDNVLWEAPNKKQQVWFIKLLGANVNLGNISPHEVMPLETLRLGLRGDTFFDYLPETFSE